MQLVNIKIFSQNTIEAKDREKIDNNSVMSSPY